MSEERLFPVSDELAASSLLNKESYQRLYQDSIHSPETFWTEQANTFIDWIEPWERLHYSDFSRAEARWFEGAKLNVCVNCVDRHLATRGDQVAIICGKATSRDASTHHLQRTARRSVPLGERAAARGVRKGDRVTHLHADDSRSRLRHARLRAHRRDPFGGLRRLFAGALRAASRTPTRTS
jgi:acetyl-CoA synthetase